MIISLKIDIYHRSMINSLICSINKISQTDEKIMKIDKKEQENNSIDSTRSIISSLSQSIDKVSEIDRKISHSSLIEKFITYISYAIMILINVIYY